MATVIPISNDSCHTVGNVELPRCQQLMFTPASDTLRVRPVVSCDASSPTSLAILTISPFAVLAFHLLSTVRSPHEAEPRLIRIIGHSRCLSCRSCRTRGLRSMPRRDCRCSCSSLGSLAGRHHGLRGYHRESGLRPRNWRAPQGRR